ncbi:MAG: hypothetical protein RLZZ248_74 [Bacteroidota bacterium]|jgi:transcriptional regulator with XRE-family HTH domain
MLKEIIKAKGLKNNFISQKLGVSEVSVSNWVKGKSTPSKKHLEKLSQLLEVPISDIVN